ncbi:mechanosensitive ion channel family protein [Occallatibacter riparius]|uniref:Mechanosensitive ion channel family protein n=1 Tax=Occallatibacter riparius TaxID=1002689 RepID=A0A9J7BVC9_9BACT|nr:mechanosensitive ion channel family protein [Occallatibacter riparius]UWZ86497.1 mechanosensitive ion channel family protein [Occallatibacter riparius]
MKTTSRIAVTTLLSLAIAASCSLRLPAQATAETPHPASTATTQLPTELAHPAPQPEAPVVAHAPVMLGNRQLFTIGRILSLPAATRATLLSARIQDLEEDQFFNPDTLTVADAEETTDIMAGDLIVMSITDQDAEDSGMTRHEMALDRAKAIAAGIKASREEHSPRRLAINTLYAAICTIIFLVLLWLLALAFPRIYRKIEAWSARMPSLHIQQFEIAAADRLGRVVIGFVKLIRLLITLQLLYIYASLVLGFFPWTRPYAQQLLSYIIDPLKAIGAALRAYLPDFFFTAVILAFAFYIIKFVRVVFNEIEKGTIRISGFYPEWAQPTFNIARLCIYALTAIVVFPYLPGSNSPAFRGISIFVGVLFSLGSTSAVANVVSGVILTYMRAFRPGDRVRIADTLGDVIEKNLLVTRVLTIKNEEVTISNAMVLGAQIINYSTHANTAGLILHTSVTIGYNAPWRTVHALLIDAALSTRDILPEPRPFVWQTALSDFYVQYEINAYTDNAKRMPDIYAELHANIQDKFNEGGVEIMSPHYSSLRDGNQVTIPDAHLPPDYAAPTFRVHLDQSGNGVASQVANTTPDSAFK